MFSPFGAGATLHHIGCVVASIDSVSSGAEIHFDPIQKVNVTFTSIHEVPLELIEPVGEDSPVKQSLRKGTKLVHLCFEVDNLESTLDECAGQGFRCIARPVPAVAFDGRRIAWVFHREFGLFELLER
jgi:methylmalonyl-CoA/ethylmalonyl-CoA epimerase